MEIPFLVPEAKARNWLRKHPGDGLEAWLAEQPWQAAEDGSWQVEPALNDCTYRIETVLDGGLRVVCRAPGGGPVTSWLIAQ